MNSQHHSTDWLLESQLAAHIDAFRHRLTNTYWYLTGVPQLMAVAGNKFEAFTQINEVNHV
ncbi:MAG: hypothetical protein Q7S94_00815 [Gallionella sp.]|nr:hypothetical protein [Gallionella sp.]